MKQRIYIAFSLVFFLAFLLLFIQSSNSQSAEVEASIVSALDLEPDGFEEALGFQLNYFFENWVVAEFISNRRAAFFVYQTPRIIFVRELPVPPPEFDLV